MGAFHVGQMKLHRNKEKNNNNHKKINKIWLRTTAVENKIF